MRYFSLVGNFSLSLTYIRQHKLGWENAIAIVHNVWVRNRGRGRELLPDKYKNLEMSAWLYQAQWDSRKSYQKKQNQSAGSHNFCARHPKLHSPSRDSRLMSLMEWSLMDCTHTTRLTLQNMGAFPNSLLRMLPCPCQSVVWGFCLEESKAGDMCSVVLPNFSQLNITDAATGTS